MTCLGAIPAIRCYSSAIRTSWPVGYPLLSGALTALYDLIH